MKRFYDPDALDNVKTFKDLEYARHGKRSMLLDLYVPEKEEQPFPLIVFIPGGAWLDSDKSDCPPMRLGYCRRGYAAASITYRTSETPFPAQLEDIKGAIRWIRAHAEKYNIDPSRIGAMGTSAGGHLVSLLGVTGKTKQFDVGEHCDQSSAIQAVCNLYGATDFLNFFNYFQGSPGKTEFMHGLIGKLLGGPLAEKNELAKQASPVNYVDADSPPFLTIHGTKDVTVPFQQAEFLHNKLCHYGVESRLLLIPSGGHGNAQLYSKALLDEVALFFDGLLHPSSPTGRCLG